MSYEQYVPVIKQVVELLVIAILVGWYSKVAFGGASRGALTAGYLAVTWLLLRGILMLPTDIVPGICIIVLGYIALQDVLTQTRRVKLLLQ